MAMQVGVGAADLAGVSDKTHLGNRASYPRFSSGQIAVLHRLGTGK